MKTLSGQTVFDVLLERSGSINELRSLLRANNVPADQHFDSGQVIVSPPVDIDPIVRYFRERDIRIVTGETNPSNYPGQSYGTSYGAQYD